MTFNIGFKPIRDDELDPVSIIGTLTMTKDTTSTLRREDVDKFQARTFPPYSQRLEENDKLVSDVSKQHGCIPVSRL